MMKITKSTILREFKCNDNPLDIFDGYALFQGKRVRSSRRWFGQGPGKYGEWLNSRVIYRGNELDYGDDPRIFIHQGNICISSTIYSHLHGCRTHLTVCNNDGTWERYFLMPPPGLEPGKNWSPFELPDGTLAFVHSFSPLVILKEIKRERGIILLSQYTGAGIPEDEGDGRFPAHRGGSNGVQFQGSIIGVGHTTKRAYSTNKEPVFSPGCGYAADHQLIHRPFVWKLDPITMALNHQTLEFPWDKRFWVIDPTSLIFDENSGSGELYTTEVERSFIDPDSVARTVKYDITIS